MNITSPRTLSWSLTGDTLFVNNWADWEAAPISIVMLLRKEEFKKPHVLLSGRNHIIAAITHPKLVIYTLLKNLVVAFISIVYQRERWNKCLR